VREWRNYSQSYVATCLGVDQSTYSRIETGRCRPSAERLQQIADVLEVPLEGLLREGALMVRIHQEVIEAHGEGLEHLPAGTLERMLAQNTERARDLERLNHRLLDLIERRRERSER
jgi:transcriptional regulator with XRE-family HTH domain